MTKNTLPKEFSLDDLLKAISREWGSYYIPHVITTDKEFLKRSSIINVKCIQCGHEEKITVLDLLERKERDGYPCPKCKHNFVFPEEHDRPSSIKDNEESTVEKKEIVDETQIPEPEEKQETIVEEVSEDDDIVEESVDDSIDEDVIEEDDDAVEEEEDIEDDIDEQDTFDGDSTDEEIDGQDIEDDEEDEETIVKGGEEIVDEDLGEEGTDDLAEDQDDVVLSEEDEIIEDEIVEEEDIVDEDEVFEEPDSHVEEERDAIVIEEKDIFESKESVPSFFDDDDEEDEDSAVRITDKATARNRYSDEGFKKGDPDAYKRYKTFEESKVFRGKKSNVFRKADQFRQHEDEFSKEFKEIAQNAIEHHTVRKAFRTIGVDNLSSVIGYNLPIYTIECIETHDIITLVGINLHDHLLQGRFIGNHAPPFDMERVVNLINSRHKNRNVKVKAIYSDMMEKRGKVLDRMLTKYLRFMAYGYDHELSEKFLDNEDHRLVLITDQNIIRSFEEEYSLNYQGRPRTMTVTGQDGKPLPSGSLAVSSIKSDDLEDIKKMMGQYTPNQGPGFTQPMNFNGQMGMNPMMGGMFGMGYGNYYAPPKQSRQSTGGAIGDVFCSIRYIEEKINNNTIGYRITDYIEDDVVSVEDGFRIAVAGLIIRHQNERPGLDININVEVDKTDMRAPFVLDNLKAYNMFSQMQTNQDLNIHAVLVDDASGNNRRAFCRTDKIYLSEKTLVSQYGRELAGINIKDPQQRNQFLDDKGWRFINGGFRWIYQVNPILYVPGPWSQTCDLYKYLGRFYGKVNLGQEGLYNKGANFDQDTQATLQRIIYADYQKAMQQQYEEYMQKYKDNPEQFQNQTVQNYTTEEPAPETEEDDRADWLDGYEKFDPQKELIKQQQEAIRKAQEAQQNQGQKSEESSGDWLDKLERVN